MANLQLLEVKNFEQLDLYQHRLTKELLGGTYQIQASGLSAMD